MRSTVTMVRQRISRSRPRLQVGDVFKIAVDPAQEFLLGVGLTAPATHLSQTGHPGFDAMPCRIVLGDRLERTSRGAGARRMRARPDQRHRSCQHVEQLRELVEGCPPKQRPDTGDARIPAGRLTAVAGVFRGIAHGAKFQHDEWAAMQANALLSEQRGAPAGQADDRSDQNHRQAHRHKKQPGQNDVRHAFDQRVARLHRAAVRTGVGEGDRSQAKLRRRCRRPVRVNGDGKRTCSAASFGIDEQQHRGRTIMDGLTSHAGAFQADYLSLVTRDCWNTQRTCFHQHRWLTMLSGKPVGGTG